MGAERDSQSKAESLVAKIKPGERMPDHLGAKLNKLLKSHLETVLKITEIPLQYLGLKTAP